MQFVLIYSAVWLSKRYSVRIVFPLAT